MPPFPGILRFSDPTQERSFRQRYAERGLPATRAALVVGVVLYGAFGVLDWVVAPNDLALLLTLRLLVVCPFGLAILALSFVARAFFLRHQDAFMVSTVLLAGLGVLAMIAWCGPPIPVSYPPGMMLVLLYGCFLARLRFAVASAVGAALVLAYVAVGVLFNPVRTAPLLTSSFFLLAAAALGMFAAWQLERLERRHFLDLRTIEEISVRDPLTGLFNRRLLDERVAELGALRRRYGVRSALAIVDLDGFKAVNDRFGHWTGDALLREVARLLTANARATDQVFRFGGDEFCLLLPNSSCAAATAILERVRAALREHPVGEGADREFLDLSAGCVAIPSAKEDLAAVIGEADALLLEAKRQGKGRILVGAGGAS